MHDIIIIGAGPAGLTAALYALRAGKTALILEKSNFGGQMTYSPKIENFPGTAQISGNELAEQLIDQVISHGADIEPEEVTGIEDLGGTKRVITTSGSYEGKAVLIAAGVKHRLTGAEGEEKFLGEGISFWRLSSSPKNAKKSLSFRTCRTSQAKSDCWTCSAERITSSISQAQPSAALRGKKNFQPL